MDNVIYIAATGMKYRTQSLDVTGNNLANIETAGFKSSKLASSAFGEYVTYRIDQEKAEIGTRTHGTIAGSIYTDFNQGAIYSTGYAYDLALDGEGFFTVADADGAMMLTRNGHFGVDREGFLVDSEGCYVMGMNGRLKAGDAFSVSESGEVTDGGRIIDTLRITNVEDTSSLKIVANGKFSYDGADIGVFGGKIIQGSLERSNVSLIDEMIDMINDTRAFQSCSQIVKIADQALQKTANEVGKL